MLLKFLCYLFLLGIAGVVFLFTYDMAEADFLPSKAESAGWVTSLTFVILGFFFL